MILLVHPKCNRWLHLYFKLLKIGIYGLIQYKMYNIVSIQSDIKLESKV